jgi:hypothetical protein
VGKHFVINEPYYQANDDCFHCLRPSQVSAPQSREPRASKQELELELGG